MLGTMREIVAFLNRQGIHIGAQAYRAATFAALAVDHTHHTGLPNFTMRFDAQSFEPVGHKRGRTVFIESQFWMGVNIAPDGR